MPMSFIALNEYGESPTQAFRILIEFKIFQLKHSLTGIWKPNSVVLGMAEFSYVFEIASQAMDVAWLNV